jgi:hypothetical protein
MKHLSSIYDLLLESVESYEFQLVSDDPMLFKYSFIDLVGNKYLVELKNIPVAKAGVLSNVYELLYFVEDKGEYSVSKIVNVNPYRVLQTVFGDILNDFIGRCSWAKNIYFVGLSKDREKDYISSRTRVYKRYLDMNPVPGFKVQQSGNAIQLTKINI